MYFTFRISASEMGGKRRERRRATVLLKRIWRLGIRIQSSGFRRAIQSVGFKRVRTAVRVRGAHNCNSSHAILVRTATFGSDIATTPQSRVSIIVICDTHKHIHTHSLARVHTHIRTQTQTHARTYTHTHTCTPCRLQHASLLQQK